MKIVPVGTGCLALVAIVEFSTGGVALAASKHRVGARHRLATEAASNSKGRQGASDDLYRRRGYGQGGLVFGGGGEGIAQAGACADLAFARPRDCGPRGGYGIYGNGLGYGFGF